jgi:GTP-binding protein
MLSPEIRNIAIIAHVDHGKTTLVDKLLNTSDERVMDCNAIENERGITILAKCTSIEWTNPRTSKPYLINIIDTPGHRDFAGEVERALSMADGAILLVDAVEGIEQQTKFVARKAIECGLKLVCVVNKVDRPDRRPEDAYLEVLEYLQSIDQRLDPPLLYASGREGWATTVLDDALDSAIQKTIDPLLETIVDYIPAPTDRFGDGKARFSVRMLDADKHLGTILVGKVESGTLKETQRGIAIDEAGKQIETARITKLMKRQGLKHYPVTEVCAGDIISMAGFTEATVGHTIVGDAQTTPVIIPKVDPPTLSIVIEPNTSPIAKKDGTKFTSQQIQERILAEAQTDVSLEAKACGAGITVTGRGEMHLGVLIENMRREGFEMTIYPPTVKLIDNQEPWETLTLDVDSEYVGDIISELNMRHAEIADTTEIGTDRYRITCAVPIKNILGYRSKFLMQTQGGGSWNQAFDSYRPSTEEIVVPRNGALISTALGVATAYALDKQKSNGIMFIEPGQEVYPGMIIGERNREDDLCINPTHSKKLTNMRASGKDDEIRLVPPRKLSLEDALLSITKGQCLEVTPLRFNLRQSQLPR